ncbi:MAG: hypothetical protein ACOX6D_08150 [Thermoguttaceae bacterium]|jgi:hypothetical protein
MRERNKNKMKLGPIGWILFILFLSLLAIYWSKGCGWGIGKGGNGIIGQQSSVKGQVGGTAPSAPTTIILSYEKISRHSDGYRATLEYDNDTRTIQAEDIKDFLSRLTAELDTLAGSGSENSSGKEFTIRTNPEDELGAHRDWIKKEIGDRLPGIKILEQKTEKNGEAKK